MHPLHDGRLPDTHTHAHTRKPLYFGTHVRIGTYWHTQGWRMDETMN